MLRKLMLNLNQLGSNNFNKIISQQKKFLATKLRRPTPIIKPESRFESIFNKLFGKYLLLTNVVTSGVLLGSGDYVLQTIDIYTGHLKEIDSNRIWRMFIVGLLMGPLHHYFYIYLEKLIPGFDVMSTIKKVAYDQAFMSPACITLFFYSAGFLENKTMEECNKEFKDKFLTVYVADWCVWPAAQYINFYYVPAKFRVIYINVLTMLYNVFVSYVKHDT